MGALQDGEQIVTAGWDRVAIIWHVASGQPLRQLGGHASFLNSAAFSPDGKLVATTSNDLTAQIQPADCRGCGTVDEVIDFARERGIRELTAVDLQRFPDARLDWWLTLTGLVHRIIEPTR